MKDGRKRLMVTRPQALGAVWDISLPPFRPPLRETCHVLHWPPRCARQTVKNSLYGEVYAFSTLAKHMGLLREFYASFLYVAPGMGAMEDFEIRLSHLLKRRMI